MILCTENDNDFIKDKVKNRKVTFTIKQISKNWWNKFLNNYLNIRNVVFLNVEKMLKFQSWDLDYAIFKCHDCGNEKIVPHTCKSRMCSSRSNKYNKKRSFSIFSKLFKYKLSQMN